MYFCRNLHPEDEDTTDTSTEWPSEYHTDEEPERPTTPLTNPFEPAMVDTPNKDAKRKLKTPIPFSGKREDLRKFLQEIKIYLMANGDSYPNNLDKILFVLSYMSEGYANSWKEEFFDTAEQTAAQTSRV